MPEGQRPYLGKQPRGEWEGGGGGGADLYKVWGAWAPCGEGVGSMNSTGKKARKAHGTRFAAKRAKARRGGRKQFGQLPISVSKGNAEAFVRAHSGGLDG